MIKAQGRQLGREVKSPPRWLARWDETYSNEQFLFFEFPMFCQNAAGHDLQFDQLSSDGDDPDVTDRWSPNARYRLGLLQCAYCFTGGLSTVNVNGYVPDLLTDGTWVGTYTCG